MGGHKLLLTNIIFLILAITVTYTQAQTTDSSETGATVVTEYVTVTTRGAATGAPVATTDTPQVATTEAPEDATTEGPEVIDGTEAPPVDYCESNPCNGTLNTYCVSGDTAHTCSCLTGYSMNNGTCKGTKSYTTHLSITTIGGTTATYTSDLADPTSAAFISLAADVEDMLDTVYMASDLADIYEGSEVTGFTEGSVGVDYNVMFAESETHEVNTTTIAESFTETVEAEMAAGNINMAVDPASITVADFDECLSADDNYCHEWANCTNTPGSFTCECGADYVDISPNPDTNPGVECGLPPTKEPNLSCESNPCTDPLKECIPSEESSTEYECQCKAGYQKDAYWSCKPLERSKNFRCYTCHDAIDINDCNGRFNNYENGSGEWCPNPTDTCYTTIQMNPKGDGWMMRKGCMDKEECYDILYGYKADPDKASCYTYVWPYGPNTGPDGGSQCHFCCNERWGLDLCNIGLMSVLYTMPFINNWDPRMNWDLSLDYDAPTEYSGAVQYLPCGPLALLIPLLLAYLLR